MAPSSIDPTEGLGREGTVIEAVLGALLFPPLYRPPAPPGAGTKARRVRAPCRRNPEAFLARGAAAGRLGRDVIRRRAHHDSGGTRDWLVGATRGGQLAAERLRRISRWILKS